MKEKEFNDTVLEEPIENVDTLLSEETEQESSEMNKDKEYLLVLQEQEIQRIKQLQRLELLIELVQDELNSKSEEIKNLQTKVDKLKPKNKVIIRKGQLYVEDSI